MAARRRLITPTLFFPLALAASACPGKSAPPIAVPKVGTTYVLIGAAGGGRSLTPRDVTVKLAAEVTSLLVPGTGAASVEMVFAGIQESDLPFGLTPDKLTFVLNTVEGSRPVPPLTAAQVLDAATPPGNPAIFVPVDEPGLSSTELADRQDRLAMLLRDLAIKDPCVMGDFAITTPRSQASAIEHARLMSSGEVVLGLAVTSTALLGVLSPPDYQTLVEVPIRTGTIAVRDGEATTVLNLGETEAMDSSGRILPGELSLLRGGILGHVAIMGSTGVYLDNTPRNLEHLPSDINGFKHLRFDGADQLCMWGGIVDSVSSQGVGLGTIWCRDPAGGPWRTVAEIPYAHHITALTVPNGSDPLAIDYNGAVYRYMMGDWHEQVRPMINQGADCQMVACAALSAVSQPDPASAGDVLAIVAGHKAETDVIRLPTPDAVQIDALTAVGQALFGDERGVGAGRAVSFIVTQYTPDQALWYGTDAPFMIRLAPDRKSAARVCLPSTVRNGAVTAIAATPEGKLVLGLTPTQIGVGTWHWQ